MTYSVKLQEVSEARELIEVHDIKIWDLGLKEIRIADLASHEKDAIEEEFEIARRHIAEISPKLAEWWEKHYHLFILAGKVAKALFEEKSIDRFPTQPEQIGVKVLIPYFIRYVATPSADEPAYSSYELNKWEINLTAGTKAYILGSDTDYWYPRKAKDKRCVVAIIYNGLIEIGSTPKIYQMSFESSQERIVKLLPMHPLIELPFDEKRKIYQYPTLGAMIIPYTVGIKWAVMPHYSGLSKLPLLGMVFYERDCYYPDLAWVA